MHKSFVPAPSDALAQALLGVLQDAVLVCDSSVVVGANDRAADLYEEDDPVRLLGRPCIELVHPGERPVSARRAERRQAGEPVAPEYDATIVTARGNVRKVHVRAALLEIDGQLLTVVSVRDRSELAGSVDAATVGDMATALAHEIRNPLATIANSAASLRRLVPQGDAVVLVGCLEEEVARLGRIVRDLVDFARSPSVVPRDESPFEVALAAVEHARALMPGTVFSVASSPGAPARYAIDGVLVQQALLQLLQNAVQASPDGSEVVVGVEGQGPLLCFTVRDHGTGLLGDAATRAFQPFFSTRAGATGLGLPIARRLAQAHGGDVWLQPCGDGGTLARLTIGDPARRLAGLRPSEPPLLSR